MTIESTPPAPREPGVDHATAEQFARTVANETYSDGDIIGEWAARGIPALARAYLALRVPAAPVRQFSAEHTRRMSEAEFTHEVGVGQPPAAPVAGCNWQTFGPGGPLATATDVCVTCGSVKRDLCLGKPAAPVSGEPCRDCCVVGGHLFNCARYAEGFENAFIAWERTLPPNELYIAGPNATDTPAAPSGGSEVSEAMVEAVLAASFCEGHKAAMVQTDSDLKRLIADSLVCRDCIRISLIAALRAGGPTP